jgi:hypothetical protein
VQLVAEKAPEVTGWHPPAGGQHVQVQLVCATMELFCLGMRCSCSAGCTAALWQQELTTQLDTAHCRSQRKLASRSSRHQPLVSNRPDATPFKQR